jgi:hypothetical protein
MATQTHPHTNRFEERRGQNEIAAELQHIRDLVRLRAIFERRGIGGDELRSYDAEIDRHRRDLALLAGQSVQHHLSAA